MLSVTPVVLMTWWHVLQNVDDVGGSVYVLMLITGLGGDVDNSS